MKDLKEIYGKEGYRQILELKKGKSVQLVSKETGNFMEITCVLPGRAYKIKFLKRDNKIGKGLE